jgi:hypothetical protein
MLMFLVSLLHIFQGCGIRSFPIGGILDAPTQVTGSPTSTAVINNSVFVSKLIRFVVFLAIFYVFNVLDNLFNIIG